MTEVQGLHIATLAAPVSKPPICLLILAAEPAASSVAKVLRARIQADTTVATDWSECLKQVHHRNFDLILLEESLVLFDPKAVDTLYERIAEGLIVEVNFGIADAARIVAQVRAALHRKARNEVSLRNATATSLRNQLAGCVNGLLLESEIALRQLAPHATPPLHRMQDLARRLSELLQSPLR